MVANIYISSTYEDLKDYRESVSNAIRRLGHVDIAMEHYVAGTVRPIQQCIDDVKRCDLYIGIFGFRYGYVPPGSTQSITEQEFRAAKKYNKDILCFIRKKNQGEQDNKVEGEMASDIIALRNEISEKYLVSFFSLPDELATIATAAIVKALSLGTTPLDLERENRLMKEWREGKSRVDRRRAAQSLINMGSTRYAAAIKDLLVEARDADDIASYMEDLLVLSVNSRQVMPYFVDFLHAESPDQRRFSIFHIGELGLRGKEIPLEIVREIIKLQNDISEGVRGELAHTLGKIHHVDEVLPTVKLCLEKLANDSNERVCERARESQRLVS